MNEIKGLKTGALDYISKPFKLEILEARVNNQLGLKAARNEIKALNLNLENLVRERTKELMLTREATIESMGVLAEYRDRETGEHIIRTKNYIKEVALHLKSHPRFKDYLDDNTIEMLYLSAPLHDIGKVGIPDAILLKPGKLTEEEFTEMKKHTTYGRDILAASEKKLGSTSFLRYAKEIAGAHHEKWDGTGYPYGLKGEEIPISGRLMAIADVYDALSSKRPYKPPFPHEQAVQIIKKGCGTHFDPDIVNAFIELEDKFKEIAVTFADGAVNAIRR